MKKGLPLVGITALRSVISAQSAVTIYWYGLRIEIEPHVILQAKRTNALVLAAWVPGRAEWGFFRYAEIRGMELLDRYFVRRTDVPRLVPSGWYRRALST